ncbi:MAG: MFS transporter [Pseudomonadota bacterium]
MHSNDTRQTRSWTPLLVVVLVAAGTVLSTSMGIRQSLGLFLGPITSGTGLSIAMFGLAMAVQNLAWGIGQPFMGALADRFGGQLVIIAGAVCFAVGLLLMRLGSAFGLFLGGGLMIGLAVAATSHGVLVGIISRIAPAKVRALAVSILAAVGSLGTFLIAPATQMSLDLFSWQTTLMILAGLAAAIGLLAAAFRTNGAAAAQAPTERPDAIGAIRQALRHPGYVAMTVAFFACGFQLIFVATHLPNFIAICGLPASLSAQAIALIGVFNALGTLAAGQLGERFGHKQVLGAIYVLRTVAIASYAFLPVSIESTLVFGAAMGLLWLSVIPPVSALINSLFGATNFGALFGVMFLSHQLGAFLGAYLGGLSFDVTGDYAVAWASLVGVGALAALIQFSMDDRPRRDAPAAA